MVALIHKLNGARGRCATASEPGLHIPPRSLSAGARTDAGTTAPVSRGTRPVPDAPLWFEFVPLLDCQMIDDPGDTGRRPGGTFGTSAFAQVTHLALQRDGSVPDRNSDARCVQFRIAN